MKSDFNNLLAMEFIPLSEAKAKLSEQVRKTLEKKRVAITTNGKPTAVLISYQEYLDLLRKLPGSQEDDPIRIIDIEEWKKERPQRLKVRDSIQELFGASKLSRKGQKTYKKETVRDFHR